ncbi:methyl-accepting chemotaxis protein [Saccharibacillus kuerlensis]|uniref:Methyl-accepting chemotaxis protein n=1 Tax=Saccharibacillus kuerlensis TaxID=459527 RepID=A0ABQ2L1Y5_9BACL|nr:methyl-accepting chemotaxis protein [Saccharibacillus kuerlensis]GGN99823.1 methyl-accepting chemotaxis protein [Saccharibacillus kuerlensis]
MQWFRNRKIFTKLMVVVMALTLLTAGVGLYGLSNINLMRDNLNKLYSENMMPIRHLAATESALLKLRITSRDIAIASTQAEKNEIAETIAPLIEEVTASIDAYRLIQMTPEEAALLADFDKNWSEYQEVYGKAIELAETSNSSAFQIYVAEEVAAVSTLVYESIEQLGTLNENLAAEADASSKADVARASFWTMIIIAASLVVGLLLVALVTTMISTPVKRINDVLKKIADGDLRETSNYTAKDEIGELSLSVSKMADTLSSLIGGIQDSAQNVAASSEQISASTQQIASGTSVQMESARSINELFQDMVTAIEDVAKGAEDAAELSNATVEMAHSGGETIQLALHSMEDVTEQVGKLEEHSTKIGDIIGVIDDISAQTNLLALNAAIEAARAGESGLGFAVVADEVRKLAERSGAATKEITTIIRSMQFNIGKSVEAVNLNLQQSEESGRAFNDIIERVGSTSLKVNGIAAASEEQSAQATEVMQTLQGITAASEESAAASEQTAASSQVLAQLADQLHLSVSKFRV